MVETRIVGNGADGVVVVIIMEDTEHIGGQKTKMRRGSSPRQTESCQIDRTGRQAGRQALQCVHIKDHLLQKATPI